MGTTSGTSSGAAPTRPADGGLPHDADADAGAQFVAWMEEQRDAAKMSWADVSRASGISENGLRKIRQGESTPKPATRDALARAFIDGGGVDRLRDIFGMTPGAEPDDPMALPPIPARRGDGGATVYLTVGISSPRAGAMDPETAGRLIRFLQASGRAWLATAECSEVA